MHQLVRDQSGGAGQRTRRLDADSRHRQPVGDEEKADDPVRASGRDEHTDQHRQSGRKDHHRSTHRTSVAS